MVQSSDRIRRWWAVPGSRVRAAGTRRKREGEDGEISGEKAVGPLCSACLRRGSWLVSRRLLTYCVTR